jgi:DNA-binding transcriptional LysR family regulator
MNDRLSALKIFVRVARTASFSRAAKELGLSQPSASRLITALEREVGARLFIRNTRAVALTDAGADYLARIEPALAMLDEANESLRGKGALGGTLRIGIPASIAIREVMPRLPAFLARHPKLRLDFVMNDKRQDLVREAIDVAIRFGDLDGPDDAARHIGRNQRVLVAAPDYLKRAGSPQSPDDLRGHIVIVGPPATMKGAWTFHRRGRTVTAGSEPLFTVNVNEAAVAAAVAGIGLLSTGLWGCAAELRRGALVQVLPDWRMASADVYAIFTPGRVIKPAARAFADFMKRSLRAAAKPKANRAVRRRRQTVTK